MILPRIAAGLLVSLLLPVCARPAGNEEKPAEEALVKLGAMVARDQPGPDAPINHVSFGASGLSDDGLKAAVPHLARLERLHTLYLGSTKVTDAGLKELAPLRQVRTLYLQNLPITDAGLEHLAGLKN